MPPLQLGKKYKYFFHVKKDESSAHSRSAGQVFLFLKFVIQLYFKVSLLTSFRVLVHIENFYLVVIIYTVPLLIPANG